MPSEQDLDAMEKKQNDYYKYITEQRDAAEINHAREAAAEEYCDKPRCANITRDCKTWHRMKAAFLAGADYSQPEIDRLTEQSNDDDTVRSNLRKENARLKVALEEIERIGTTHDIEFGSGKNMQAMIAREALDD